MKNALKRKIVAWLSLFLVLFQNAYPLAVYASDPTPSPTPIVEETPAPTLEPTSEPTPTPTPEVNPEPTEAPTSTPTPEPTIEPTPIATHSTQPSPSPTPTSNQNNDESSNEQSSNNNSNSSSNEEAPEPSANPSPTPEAFDEQLQAVIIENVVASSIDLLDLEVSETGSATLSTDKPDYAPTDTALITGVDFEPNTTYSLTISSNDPPATSTTVEVTADENGEILYAYQLDGTYRPNYVVIARDENDNMVATITFTDAPPVPSNPSTNLDQCANGGVGDPPVPCIGSAWQNGNLNGNQAHYREDDSVPYRFIMSNLSLGAHSIVIEWDTTKGGVHATDYLTSFNRTEVTADPCSGVVGCGSPTTFAIPDDPNSSVVQEAGSFTLYNGTINSLSAYVVAGTYASDSSTRITINFTANTSSPVLAVGGHIASQNDWGAGNSASGISGSPYHMRVISLDGSGGNQDRSLSAGAVPSVPGLVTQVSSADVYVNQTVSDIATYTEVGQDGPVAGTTTFFVCGPDQTAIACSTGGTQVGTAITNTNNQAISSLYTPTQTGHYCFRAEYTPSATAQYSPINHTNTTTECFNVTNPPQGNLIINKVTIGGDDTFSFIVSGPTSSAPNIITNSGSGTTGSMVVTPGSYTVSETVPLGWELTNNDCANSFTINSSETKTCTFTNTKNSSITVVKTVVNDNGGSAEAGSFPLFINDTQVVSGVSNPLAVGTYIISETQQSGYTQTNITCDNNKKNPVALNPGDNVTCTITNDDNQSYIIVDKTVINDNGGLAVADDFDLTIDGNEVLDGAAYPINPGTHTVGETTLPGYTAGAWGGDCDLNAGVSVALGETKTCTITNDDDPATLIVKKVVVGSNDPVTNFDFLINNAGQQTFEADGQNDITVDAGTYTVTEVSEEGYTASYDNCSNIILGNGDSAICTITNTRDTGFVTFEKIVIGGNASPSAWLFTISGDNGVFTSGQSTTLPTGSYTVTESGGVPDYSATSAVGICSGLQDQTATLNVTKEGGTCTFTNTRDTGSLKVNKRTDANGDGDFGDTGEGVNGSASNAFTWSLDESGANVMGATVSNIITGNHNVGENTVANYHFVGWFTTGSTQYSCTSPEGTTLPVVVSVTKNQTTEITLCNARDAGSIVIVKDAINNNGQDFNFTTTGGLTPSSFILDDDGNNNNTRSNTRVYGAAVTGQYTITEGATSGWRLTNLVCNDNNGIVNLNDRQAIINVETGETVTCTFTNTQLGSIAGYKYNDQDGDNNKDFLEPNLNGWTIFIDANDNSTLDSGETSASTSGWFFVNLGLYSFNNLLPGTYRVCEVPQSGWTSSLPDGATCQNVTVSPGENETAVFGNHEPLTVNAYKVVCETEADLPNWGVDAPNITTSTAQNFVNQSNGKCQLVEGWDFQYGYDGEVSKYGNGDQVGSAPSPWQVLGTTNSAGVAQITINDLENTNGLWVREVLQENYVPFSYPTAGPTENSYSAELYCSTDGQNYDNFDQIDRPLYGNTYSCVAFNALNTGTITIDKVTDPIESTQMFDFTLMKSETVIGEHSLADDTEPYTFEDLIVGTYTVTEANEEGWDFVSLTCSDEESMTNGGTITVSPNEDVRCTFTNRQRGSVDVIKYNDENGNGQKDEEEGTLAGWEFNLSEQESQITGEDGEVTFTNLIPGEYSLTETTQEGWLQTNISCTNNNEQSEEVVVLPGQTTTCEVGNQASPVVTIEKANDAVVTKAPGDTVVFTLTVKVSGSDVNNLIVTDLPAKGFTVKSDSLKVAKNGGASLVASMLHGYASPGKWDLGNAEVGDEYVLTYEATIASDQESGTYNDLAWAEGSNETWGEVLAVGENSEYTNGNFVGTSVPVGVNPNPSSKFGSSGGAVLGASTELPSTGADALGLFLSLGLITVGYTLRKVSRKFEN